MNKVTASVIAQGGAPTFASVAYSPDNAQNARRYIPGVFISSEFPEGLTVEVSELTAPATAAGPAKLVSRARGSVPQLRAASSGDSTGTTVLQMTGQNEYFQATLTLTVPAVWAKVITSKLPSSTDLKLAAVTLARSLVLDTVNGTFGDLKPSTAFAAAAYTTMPPVTSPFMRALQGANPEDVFSGSYGVAP